ncbi:MAG: ribosome silencing factor [Defluviitaleaceae bacterium]|nr:ribosome silencing factor [Defluviitaleaceae bacterium]
MIEVIEKLKKVLEEKFAKDIVILDISKVSILGDYFIIATGKNENQIKAMGDAASEYLEKQNITLKHNEGVNYNGWYLLDFGDVILHLFDEESREFYKIERIWADALVI